jgi:microsomal dipeptidase-like Zn-dependent dipeptidase
MAVTSKLDWERIHHEATVVDLHIHPSMKQQLFNRNLGIRYFVTRTTNILGVQSSFPRLRSGGYDLMLSVLHVPEKGLLNDFPVVNLFRLLRPDLWHKLIAAPPFRATIKILEDMEAAVAQSSSVPMKLAHSAGELGSLLNQAKGSRPIAVVHAVEGAHSLGGKEATEEGILRNLDELHRRGVAYITLAHFYPNRVVHPCYPFPESFAHLAKNPDLWRDLTLGLTPLGRRVVEHMIELGMAIDLSHSTPIARQQVYDICEASNRRVPLFATHVGAYEINPSPYNLQDWEVKRIARDGGVVGVIFMNYWLMPHETGQGLNFVSRTIDHLVRVGGEDVVGFGSDFDGFADPPDDLHDASQLARLTQRLVTDGHGEERIKKILGGNALRALCENWSRRVA